MGWPVIIDKRFEGPLSCDLSDYPDGLIFVVDKPYRWTSSDVVRKLKFALQKNFKVKNIKIGHTGTLDPLATGLLLVCAGKATKLAETLQSHEKEYVAGVSFGATTPSFDLEKPIDAHYPCAHITRDTVEAACRQFIGDQQQIPPMFSAKMIDGVRAYEYAREGEQMPLKSSLVSIHEIEVIDFHPEYSSPEAQQPIRESTAAQANDSCLKDFPRPMATIRLRCSRGTYVRSFARDLGLSLSSGAYLCSLKRTISGEFEIKNAICLDNLISRSYFCHLN